MAGKIKQLWDSLSRTERWFPITLTKAVYDEEGNRLDNTLKKLTYDTDEIVATKSYTATTSIVSVGTTVGSIVVQYGDKIKINSISSGTVMTEGTDPINLKAGDIVELYDTGLVTVSGIIIQNGTTSISIIRKKENTVQTLTQDVNQLNSDLANIVKPVFATPVPSNSTVRFELSKGGHYAIFCNGSSGNHRGFYIFYASNGISVGYVVPILNQSNIAITFNNKGLDISYNGSAGTLQIEIWGVV